jgi:hypothetical protein
MVCSEQSGSGMEANWKKRERGKRKDNIYLARPVMKTSKMMIMTTICIDLVMYLLNLLTILFFLFSFLSLLFIIINKLSLN